MNLKRSLTLPFAASAALVAGLTLGALSPDWGVAAPTPITEDDPRWDCATMGNGICGPTADTAAAWEVFDYAGGPAKLKVDPAREFRVVFLGTSDAYPPVSPDTLVLPAKDGQWYLFRADY